MDKNVLVGSKNVTIGEHLQQGYIGSQSLIPEDDYVKVLDSIVFACVDILPIFGSKVLIGKRIHEPQSDWWLFGGRMRTGERFLDSATRIMKNETNLIIQPGTFLYLTAFNAAWNKREQSPTNRGVQTVSLVFTINLDQSDIENLILNEEYSEAKLIDPNDILDDVSYHPGLRQCISALSNSR
jgi:ADP-ribose pyrophosphatase YjhB (NUDIX family)